jgi:uncharacterized protein YjbJ (UPF0337 family)
MCESCNQFQMLCNIGRNKAAHLCNNKISKNRMINSIQGKGNWNYQKAKLKEKFAILTDDDLLYEQGKKDEMLGKIQIKLDKTKEELDIIIEAF